MLTLRKRSGIFYLRGQVRIGKKIEKIPEHSTGTADKSLAESYRAQVQREAETRLLHGAAVARGEMTFANAALLYVEAQSRHASDLTRVRQLSDFFGKFSLSHIDAGMFGDFCRENMAGTKGSTRQRLKVTMSGVFRAAGAIMPEISVPAKPSVIVSWLAHEQADKLVSSYTAHVQPIALMARYCGLRAGELVRLERRDVDLAHGPCGAVRVRSSKNGRDRFVPLHPRVRAAILGLPERASWQRMFLNARGDGYADTRMKGGNPLRKAHATACARAGIQGFRFHDWRHHWATWAIQPIDRGGSGLNHLELQKLGGWQSLHMVQRYAATDLESIALRVANGR